MNARQQHGSALMLALALLTLVAALGAFAVQLNMSQQQTSSLQVIGYRAESAANAGLETFANVVANNPATPCPTVSPTSSRSIAIGSAAADEPFTVRLIGCTRIASGARSVYEVTVEAYRGSFGQPNYVRRTISRRISTIVGGT